MFLTMEDVPDYNLDPPECSCVGHKDECECDHCHDCRPHTWTDWNIEPPCDSCRRELSTWIHENTDLQGCAYPDVCDYLKTCGQKEVPRDRKIA